MEHSGMQEVFLINYFMADALMGESAADGFDALADICRIPLGQRGELFALVNEEDLTSIRSFDTYERTMRVLDYQNNVGNPVPVEDGVLAALAYKGEALRLLAHVFHRGAATLSREGLRRVLTEELDFARVEYLAFVAFLKTAGAIFDRDEKEARSLAVAAAKWNNAFGILLASALGEREYERNLSLAYPALGQAPTGEAELLEEFFRISKKERMSGADREHYSEEIADLVYAKCFSLRDKRKVLFSRSFDLLQSVSAFALGDVPCLPMPRKAASFGTEGRAEEGREIYRCLSDGECRALTLEFHDAAMKETYLSKIGALFESPIRIDLSYLPREALLSDDTNRILSEIAASGRMSGVILLEGVESLNKEQLDELMQFFLSRDGRYFIRRRNVSVDLSGYRFVLAVMGEADQRLKDVSASVAVRPADEEEIARQINESLEESKRHYGCQGVTFDRSAREAVEGYPSRQRKVIIERICANFAQGEQERVITATDVRGMVFGFEKPRMGF
ncbi:MAG: hypothetical protein ACI4U2_06795 [Christensenellaceae bacterium]